MRRVSLKLAKKQREYNKLKAEFLKGKHCEYPGCFSEQLSVHHSKGRCGELLTDVRYFKALCVLHHQLIEVSPAHARELGLSESRLEK